MNLTPGQRLFTKDGRQIGNAIVRSVKHDQELGLLHTIETDFGNTATMTRREVDELFFTDPVSVTSVNQWLQERNDLQKYATPDL